MISELSRVPLRGIRQSPALAQLEPEAGKAAAAVDRPAVTAQETSPEDAPVSGPITSSAERCRWLWSCVSIILIAGVLGGTVSSVLELRQPPAGLQGLAPESAGERPGTWQVAWPNILLGVAAACLTPLFLHFTSSKLVSDILDGSNSYEGSLIFFGYCLIAAISARSFIRTITSQVLRETQQKAAEAARLAADAEARAVAAEAKAQAAQDTAEETQNLVSEDDAALPDVSGLVDAADDRSLGLSARAAASAELVSEESPDDLASRTLQAIASSRLVLRSSTAIARELNRPREEIERALQQLELHGSVERKQSPKGERWRITPQGRRATMR